MNEAAPPVLHQQAVLPEWIDHNGHMNVAYYVLVFDQSLDVFLDDVGLHHTYRNREDNTVYVLEAHVTYIQEVHEGDPLVMSVRLLDYDHKRIHLFLEMRHRDKGFLAATSEQMILHIDRAGPKATDMPSDIQAALKARYEETAHLPRPKQAGAVIGIRRK